MVGGSECREASGEAVNLDLDFWILDFGFVSGEIEHVVGGSEC